MYNHFMSTNFFSDLFSSRSDNPIARWWWSIDKLNFILIVSLMIFGVVMIGTASPSVAKRIDLGGYHFLIRHVMFLVPCFLVMVSISLLSLKSIWRICLGLYAISLLGLLLSLFIGAEIKGATRWIRVLGFSVQPSEFMKPAFIIVSAWFLSKQKLNVDFPGVLFAFALYGFTALLLLLQPDFGMFFLVSCIFGMQIFLSGCPLRYIFILGCMGICAIILAYFSLGHVQERLNSFIFPETSDTYQIDRSKEAFMNGGFIGTGLGQGTVKNQVPDVHADFIFTAVGEEWGFLMTAILVSIFSLVFYRFFSRLARSESLFVMLGGGGLVFMLSLQCFIHMGATLQLIPAKGMTLPLISYGGSSLIAVGISLGLIIALSRGINDEVRKSSWRHLKKRDF